MWRCECDCGNQVVVAGGSIRSGDTRSCGCYNIDALRKNKRTHGLTESSEYRTWCHMKARCHTPTDDDYKNYGARGIYVCERWRKSFEAFLADMGPRPSSRHTIERVDNNGPYSPENCCWLERVYQNRNKRNVRRITHDGLTRTPQEWARVVGIDWRRIDDRLRKGWTVKRALTEPLRPLRRHGTCFQGRHV